MQKERPIRNGMDVIILEYVTVHQYITAIFLTHPENSNHKWLKTKLEIYYDLFKQHCMSVNSLILDSKKTFYSDKIDSCAGDQKKLFKIIDRIMHNYKEPQLPSHNSLDEFVTKFADFFVTKNS